MARVPAAIPKEPGAQRCGDTYEKVIYVNGLIPGTSFGGQFEQQISPVTFGDYGQVGPPLLKDDAEVEAAVAPIEERLAATLNKLELESQLFRPNETNAIEKLIEAGFNLCSQARAEDLYQAQLPGQKSKGSPTKVRRLMIEALQHLRCAEYWTWRVVLYQQAVGEYVPELGLAGAPQVGQPAVSVFPVPVDWPGLGGTGEPTKPSKKKESMNTWLIVGGLGLAAAFYYYRTKLSR